MKIAYLSTFYPYRGGIAQFNASLYNQLSRTNVIKAYTFTLQYPQLLFPGTSQMVQKGDNALVIDAERVLNTIQPLSYISAARKIKAAKPDILLTKFWMPYFAPSLGYVSGKLKKSSSVISILDNVIPHELRFCDLMLIKYFLNRNDAFVVMSETVKRDLLKLKPDAKFVFHQHPLYEHFGDKIQKLDARAHLGLPQDKKIILCYGFIRDYKGIDLAISAISRLGDDYHLVIAGEVYGSFDKYQSQINELNAGGKISLFTRYISDDETPFFFSAADACLLPYKSATQSGIIAIAYHFDLPVIATNVGGLSEMIEPYGAGIMIDRPESSAIAEGIKRFFNFNTDEFIANIQSYKLKASWKSLAETIINLAGEIKK